MLSSCIRNFSLDRQFTRIDRISVHPYNEDTCETRQPLGVVILLAAIAVYALVAYLTSGRVWSWGIFRPHPTETDNTKKGKEKK